MILTVIHDQETNLGIAALVAEALFGAGLTEGFPSAEDPKKLVAYRETGAAGGGIQVQSIVENGPFVKAAFVAVKFQVLELHHVAIPDSSGTTCGLLNWAVYSQPSGPTLEAFLKLFNELLTEQPFRIRSSRYIFLVTEGAPLQRADVYQLLSSVAGKVDFYCDSLDDALSVPEGSAPLDSINVLASADACFLGRGDLTDKSKDLADIKKLTTLCESIGAQKPSQVSSIPPSLWRAFVDSSFILSAFRFGISSGQAAALCGARGGIGAHIARARAHDSRWGKASIEYCDSILETCPFKAFSYRVEHGDMLSRIIRRRYGVSFDRLWPIVKVLNPTIDNPDHIIAGREIKLPELNGT